jgi:BlaI family transcriptional regulator, penicillinase repressor
MSGAPGLSGDSIDWRYYNIVDFEKPVAKPKFTRLELRILESLWARGHASIREIQASFPAPKPAYTTVQTVVYRLEGKKAVRRVSKISNADIFEPVVDRDMTRLRMLDEILSFFGGKAQPMMAQLAEAGKITHDDIRELERLLDSRASRKPDKAGRAK